MKTLLVLALGLVTPAFAEAINYSNSSVFPLESVGHKLTDAEYKEIPTKIEMRSIPGCVSNAESQSSCTEAVVLKSIGVINVNISYLGSLNPTSEGQSGEWTTLTFKLSDFSASEVEMLKSAYPRYKHPFSSAPKKFVARNFEMHISRESKIIKVLDMSKTHLCRARTDGTKIPGCVEHLVYRNAETEFKLATVLVK
jgi:hypothetical protein